MLSIQEQDTAFLILSHLNIVLFIIPCKTFARLSRHFMENGGIFFGYTENTLHCVHWGKVKYEFSYFNNL